MSANTRRFLHVIRAAIGYSMSGRLSYSDLPTTVTSSLTVRSSTQTHGECGSMIELPSASRTARLFRVASTARVPDDGVLY